MENEVLNLKNFVNDYILILNGTLLISIHIGFACIEASRTRLKYMSYAFFKVLLNIFVSSLVYRLTGCGLSYEKGNNFMGFTWWYDFNNRKLIESDWLYEYVISSIPVTILSGSVVELCHPAAFVASSILLSGIVQPVVKYWVWNPEGWLKNLGVVDFAGCSTVFAFAGAACFATILLQLKRKINPIYSPPLFGVGVLITVFGFLILNCGALHRSGDSINSSVLSDVIQNTILSGACGCIVALLTTTIILNKKYLIVSTLHSVTASGALSGMVAICGATNRYTILDAMIVGAVSGLIFALFRHLLSSIKVIDNGDAFVIYFGSGLWGMLAPYILTSNGLMGMYNVNNSFWNLLKSFIGTMIISAWSALWTIILFLILKLPIFGALKKDDADETQKYVTDSNLNLHHNDEACYIEALPYSMSDKDGADAADGPSAFPGRSNPLRAKRTSRDLNLYENIRLHNMARMKI